eukprot:s225_g56.t1
MIGGRQLFQSTKIKRFQPKATHLFGSLQEQQQQEQPEQHGVFLPAGMVFSCREVVHHAAVAVAIAAAAAAAGHGVFLPAGAVMPHRDVLLCQLFSRTPRAALRVAHGTK